MSLLINNIYMKIFLFLITGGPVATFVVGTAVFSYNIYKYLTCDPNPSELFYSCYM